MHFGNFIVLAGVFFDLPHIYSLFRWEYYPNDFWINNDLSQFGTLCEILSRKQKSQLFFIFIKFIIFPCKKYFLILCSSSHKKSDFFFIRLFFLFFNKISFILNLCTLLTSVFWFRYERCFSPSWIIPLPSSLSLP